MRSDHSKMIIKNCLMYIAISKLNKEKKIISKSSRKALAILLYIPGSILAFYIANTKRRALSVPEKH